MSAFTVVVPTRDRPGPLGECLRGLGRLEPPPGGLDVVVVDDGGVARLDPVLAAAAPGLEVTLVRRSASGGPAAARNDGAARARGDVLAFTDDDCVPDPGWLVELARALARVPGSAAGGTTVTALPDNPWAVASQTVEDAVYAHENADPDRARFFATKNLAVPAAAFAEVGGFDARFRTSEDREFCDRWRLSGRRLVHAPAAVVAHAHPRSARQFVAQHVGYGRGGYRFRSRRLARGQPGLRPDPRFYARLLARPFARPPEAGSRLTLAALVAASQALTVTGFALEAGSSRRAAGRARSAGPRARG